MDPWFVFPLIGINFLVILILMELFAVVFEACFIYLLNKKVISLKMSFVLSVFMNVISVMGGVMIMLIAFVSGVSFF